MPSRETKEALRGLLKAMEKLLYTVTEEEWDELVENYPFDHSFDDLVEEVRDWVETHA
jgi:hypothetical protein